MKRVSFAKQAIFFSVISFVIFAAQAQEVYPGWAFLANGKSCYIYNVDKSVVHTWTSTFNSAAACRLMRDSSVMFNGRNPVGWTGTAPLTSGRFQIIKWNGTLAWDFQYSSSEYCPHHNIELIYKTDDPKEVPNLLIACYTHEGGSDKLVDKVVEIKPTGATTGEIVWEWHSWEHRNSTKTDPLLLCESASTLEMKDWTHLNSISYNRDLDQVVFGLKHFREFIVIDHSTTTQQSSSHSGGKYGKGGDILYRWGRPSNYGASGNDYFDGFHSARWIPKTFPGTNLQVPGGGNVMVYQNITKEADEIQLPGTGNGIYPYSTGQPYAPDKVLWSCPLTKANRMEGSVQRLPNGNTFICDASTSLYEVTPDGKTIWTMSNTGALQALKYAYSYFSSGTPIKEKPVKSTQTPRVKISSCAGTTELVVEFVNHIDNARINIFNLNGQKIYERSVSTNRFVWRSNNCSNGMYIIEICAGEAISTSYFAVRK